MTDINGAEAQVAEAETKKAETLPEDASLASTQDEQLPAQGEPEDKQSGFEKRIAKEVRRRKEIEDMLIHESSQRQHYEQKLNSMQSQQQPQQADPNEPKRPERSSYESDPNGYTEALIQYSEQKIKHEQKKFTQQQQMSHREQYMQQINKDHAERLIQTAAKYEDFEETVKNLEYLPIDSNNPSVQNIVASIMEMPNSAEVTYYLGKNTEKATEITKMPANRALIELGKLSAKLDVPQVIAPSKDVEPPVRVDGKVASSNGRPSMTDLRKQLYSR